MDRFDHQGRSAAPAAGNKALVGFTRVDAPEWGDPDSSQRAPLSEGDPTWVPAATTHGEGIFLVLRTDVMSDFERLIAPLRSAPAGLTRNLLDRRDQSHEPDASPTTSEPNRARPAQRIGMGIR